ncbi:MAG: protease modulator HflC [Synergistaceae bacterium]|jgi:membrane protease subunit HflC|nr:protease modulator HflC [Synergistaceae bacterium]
MKKYFAIPVVVLFLAVALGAFYIVPTNEHAVVTQFGKIVRVHSTPGIHAKIPFLDVVYRYPKWLQEHDSAPVETVLGDKRNVVFDTFLLYQITDPSAFHTRIRTQETLGQRIDDVIFGAIRVVAGLYTYDDILNGKREEIIQHTMTRVREQTKDMGIDVVLSAIRNFTLPDQNLQAIYSNMKSERVRIAQRILSAGTAEANRITAEADRRAQEIIASAVKKNQTLRGEGDKEAQIIISDAMGNAFSLYEQMKAVEFFQKGIKENTVLIVDPKTGLFKYLNTAGSGAAKKEVTEGQQ